MLNVRSAASPPSEKAESRHHPSRALGWQARPTAETGIRQRNKRPIFALDLEDTTDDLKAMGQLGARCKQGSHQNHSPWFHQSTLYDKPLPRTRPLFVFRLNQACPYLAEAHCQVGQVTWKHPMTTGPGECYPGGMTELGRRALLAWKRPPRHFDVGIFPSGYTKQVLSKWEVVLYIQQINWVEISDVLPLFCP